MGFAKHEMMRQEDMYREASDIAVKAGAITPCEIHGHVLINAFADTTAAYKLGNAKFTNGTLSNDFKSRRELTDFIKEAIDESCLECPYCAKIWKG